MLRVRGQVSGTEREYSEREALLEELLEQINDRAEWRRSHQEETARQQRARDCNGARVCEMALLRQGQDVQRLESVSHMPGSADEDMASSKEPHGRQRTPNMRSLIVMLVQRMVARDSMARYASLRMLTEALHLYLHANIRAPFIG
jgi:hypothetical protein